MGRPAWLVFLSECIKSRAVFQTLRNTTNIVWTSRLVLAIVCILQPDTGVSGAGVLFSSRCQSFRLSRYY